MTAEDVLRAEAALEQEDDKKLLVFNLKWHRELRLLQCLECVKVVGSSFDQHVRKVHNAKMSQSEETFVRKLCFDEHVLPSPYRSKTMTLLPPVPFIDVQKGFRCPSCAYYTSTMKPMVKHLKDQHQSEDLRPVECPVQTISTQKWRTFFGVQCVDAVAQQEVSDTDNEQAMGLMEMMAHVLAPVAGVETVQQKSLFYSTMGWYGSEDPYAEVNQLPYVLTPSASDAEHGAWTRIHHLYEYELSQVQYRRASFRYSVGPETRDALNALQQPATMDLYSREFTRFVFFAIRLWRCPLDQKVLSPEITAAIIKVVDVFGSAEYDESSDEGICALAELGLELLREKETKDSHKVVELFMRFYCLKEGRELRDADAVTHMCSRVLSSLISADFYIYIFSWPISFA